MRFSLQLATNLHFENKLASCKEELHVQQLANFVESCSKKQNPSNFSCNLQHGKLLRGVTRCDSFCNLQHSVICCKLQEKSHRGPMLKTLDLTVCSAVHQPLISYFDSYKFVYVEQPPGILYQLTLDSQNNIKIFKNNL